MVSAPPAFSVVIPCHNYGHFLPAAIESVLAQGRDDVEIIVVDDASTDDTTAVAKDFGDPVRFVELATNVGPGGAWSVGITSARGRYLCRLDADDWQLPGFLDRVEEEFQRDERIGLVATAVYLHHDGSRAATAQAPTKHDVVLDEAALRRRLLRKYFVRMPATAMRGAAVEGKPLPRTDLRMGEDWEYLLRTLRGWRASLITRPFAVNRLHTDSLTSTSYSGGTLLAELERLLAMTRDVEDPAYLTKPERRLFALGVAESYLGNVGRRLTMRDLVAVAGHVRVAASLVASEDPLAAPLLLRYVAWGAWQRLMVGRRRESFGIDGPLGC